MDPIQRVRGLFTDMDLDQDLCHGPHFVSHRKIERHKSGNISKLIDPLKKKKKILVSA